ncbi:MAG TPA: ATP-binding protein, partial [Cryptosporangiaceae bacterium]|nr:ATP-binding protein [Cryptosporangiaceae bacterium]
AGEQEEALRSLVGSHQPRLRDDGLVDLLDDLARFRSPHVKVSSPAGPVLVPGVVADELTAAVGAALHNVREHVGPEARAWVLVEETDAEVLVTVRDDGPGIPPGRLESAAADGRLGVAQSIRGRLRDLGGSARVTSAPGEGTEVELRVPRR